MFTDKNQHDKYATTTMMVHNPSKMTTTTTLGGVYFAVVASLAICLALSSGVGSVQGFQTPTIESTRTSCHRLRPVASSPSPLQCPRTTAQTTESSSSCRRQCMMKEKQTTTTTTTPLAMTKSTDMDYDESDIDCISILSPNQRKLIFGGAFIGENVLSYTGPGSDGTLFPQQDLDLILNNLMNPDVMSNPPDGSGYGIFSYLLFNSFIYLPFVWSAIILPPESGEDAAKKQQVLPAWPFLVSSTAFGGIGLYPYLAVRKSPMTTTTTMTKTLTTTSDDDNNDKKSSFVLNFFQGDYSILLKMLLLVCNLYLLQIFLEPFLSGNSNLLVELQGFFNNLLWNSQFVFTTTVDAIILSLLLLDPISDDAKRHGILNKNANLLEAASKLWPFLFPVFGSLFWVLFRPPIVVEEYD